MYKGKWTRKQRKARAAALVNRRRTSAGSRRRGENQREKETKGSLILCCMVFLISLALVVIAGYQLVTYLADISASQQTADYLSSIAVETVDRTPVETLAISPTMPSEAGITQPAHRQETQPAEQPKEYAPIRVDFDRLKQESQDIIGWLYCPDSNINYPVMRSQNNQDYIRMLPNGTVNAAGSLFLDFRCQSDFAAGYSVIYGHNMKNDTMFGSLEEYRDQAYYEAHDVLYLITEEAAYRVDLLAGVVTYGTSDYYGLPMNEITSAQKVQEAMTSSTFQTRAENTQGPYLLLSTCVYDYEDARFLLIGSLTQIEKE